MPVVLGFSKLPLMHFSMKEKQRVKYMGPAIANVLLWLPPGTIQHSLYFDFVDLLNNSQVYAVGTNVS